jgi:hypothetical protein
VDSFGEILDGRRIHARYGIYLSCTDPKVSRGTTEPVSEARASFSRVEVV